MADLFSVETLKPVAVAETYAGRDSNSRIETLMFAKLVNFRSGKSLGVARVNLINRPGSMIIVSVFTHHYETCLQNPLEAVEH